jgi:hypothetical protein
VTIKSERIRLEVRSEAGPQAFGAAADFVANREERSRRGREIMGDRCGSSRLHSVGGVPVSGNVG